MRKMTFKREERGRRFVSMFKGEGKRGDEFLGFYVGRQKSNDEARLKRNGKTTSEKTHL